MVQFARSNLGSDDREFLMKRLAAATLAAKAAAERYSAVMRRSAETVERAREAVAASQELREGLKQVVSAYARVLRHDGETPERVAKLVRDAMAVSQLPLDPDRQRTIQDDIVRWAMDAYHAA